MIQPNLRAPIHPPAGQLQEADPQPHGSFREHRARWALASPPRLGQPRCKCRARSCSRREALGTRAAQGLAGSLARGSLSAREAWPAGLALSRGSFCSIPGTSNQGRCPPVPLLPAWPCTSGCTGGCCSLAAREEHRQPPGEAGKGCSWQDHPVPSCSRAWRSGRGQPQDPCLLLGQMAGKQNVAPAGRAASRPRWALSICSLLPGCLSFPASGEMMRMEQLQLPLRPQDGSSLG